MNVCEHICLAGSILFERRLTDLAGGNISVRDGDTIYMTPTYSGARLHWNLVEEDIISGKLDGDELTSHPKFSREGWSHLALYHNFPDIKAVIHAHAFHVMPFSALGVPMEPLLEANDKFGTIPVIDSAPGHTRELADKVVAGFRGQEERIRKMAAVVIIPRHGLIAGGKDLDLTLDAVERVDTNAWCILMAKMWRAG